VSAGVDAEVEARIGPERERVSVVGRELVQAAAEGAIGRERPAHLEDAGLLHHVALAELGPDDAALLDDHAVVEDVARGHEHGDRALLGLRVAAEGEHVAARGEVERGRGPLARSKRRVIRPERAAAVDGADDVGLVLGFSVPVDHAHAEDPVARGEGHRLAFDDVDLGRGAGVSRARADERAVVAGREREPRAEPTHGEGLPVELHDDRRVGVGLGLERRDEQCSVTTWNYGQICRELVARWVGELRAEAPLVSSRGALCGDEGRDEAGADRHAAAAGRGDLRDGAGGSRERHGLRANDGGP
jgi:hypothetical protein